MIILGLLILIDVIVFPVNGLFAAGVFTITLLAGVLLVRDHKKWFLVSLTLITLATIIYLIGDQVVNDTVVHKLSDWSLTSLVIAVIYLAINSRKSL